LRQLSSSDFKGAAVAAIKRKRKRYRGKKETR